MRLACLKHTASVRPEPGSNSPKKICSALIFRRTTSLAFLHCLVFKVRRQPRFRGEVRIISPCRFKRQPRKFFLPWPPSWRQDAMLPHHRRALQHTVFGVLPTVSETRRYATSSPSCLTTHSFWHAAADRNGDKTLCYLILTVPHNTQFLVCYGSQRRQEAIISGREHSYNPKFPEAEAEPAEHTRNTLLHRATRAGTAFSVMDPTQQIPLRMISGWVAVSW